ncbi:hypothetical protein HRbin40_00155 [bacterium HR40]|nr:hypothetical protein HRbin40_00155 [bacterium HR40]
MRCRIRGRGAGENPPNRFEALAREPFDDGFGTLDVVAAESVPPATEVLLDRSRTVLARNESPDIPFDRSVNPYRGCEHGCIYCYARPTHNWLGFSSGLDFETKILVKPEAAELLRHELARPGYRCAPIALGTNTDPYQPLERRLRVTRSILELLAACRHPVGIVTKSAGVLRDLDLLVPMARDGLASVFLSITTLDAALARRLEPRAAAPHRRLEAIRALASAGVPTGVMVAPVIPALTDHELERILEAAAEAGAERAGWILLRLPHDVKDLFDAWLLRHVPARRERVLARIRECRAGRLNDPAFGSRLRGTGVWAQLLDQRFAKACARLGLNRRTFPARTDLFRPPSESRQLDLFG